MAHSSHLKELVAATSSLQEQLKRVVNKLEDNEIDSGTQPSASQLSLVDSKEDPGPRPVASSSRVNIWSPMAVLGKRRGDTEQEVVPDPSDRALLQIAGLGEKKIQFDSDSGANGIHEEILSQFPKLKESGGYELMRTQEKGSKLLYVIDVPPSGYSVAYLKAVAHSARIFIRPLQRDLSLLPEEVVEMRETPPKEECRYCKKMIDIIALRRHLDACFENMKDYENPAASKEDCESGNDEHSVADPFIPVVSPVVQEVVINDHGITQEEDTFIEISSGSPSFVKSPEVVIEHEIKTTADLVKHLSKTVNDDFEFDMIVRRSNLLLDALQQMQKVSFDPRKRLNVMFVGEAGSDVGGLTREFFRLIKYDMSIYIDSTGSLKHNSLALQDNVYLRLGILSGMALTQGGGSFPILSHSVFRFVCGFNLADLSPGINEVADSGTKTILNEINSCNETTELKELLTDNVEMLFNSGFSKPVTKLTIKDKERIIQSVTLHNVILHSLAELSQFREGIWKIEGMKEALANYSDLFESFYCVCNQNILLTANKLRQLFTTVKFSEKGSNARDREEAAYMFFVTYMEDCEGGVGSDIVKLEKILSFFTGADSIPPLGYESVTLNFNNEIVYPAASTCAIELTLPTMHKDYSVFKEHMHLALTTMHGGFGFV